MKNEANQLVGFTGSTDHQPQNLAGTQGMNVLNVETGRLGIGPEQASRVAQEIADAIAAEREACAKIADDAAPTSATGPHAEGQRMSCGQVAAAIRARSK